MLWTNQQTDRQTAMPLARLQIIPQRAAQLNLDLKQQNIDRAHPMLVSRMLLFSTVTNVICSYI